MIINAAAIAAISAGFRAEFQGAYDGTTAIFERIATSVPSSGPSENYGWLGQWPQLREWVGDRLLKDISAHKYSIDNKKFEGSVGVKADDIKDDRLGVYKPMFEEMGRAAKTHPDELVFNLLNAGTSQLCYDGQNFFDTDHPVIINGAAETVSNFQAGAGEPWYLLDCSRKLKPLIFQKRQDYNFVAMTKPDDEAVFMRDEFRYGVDARCNVGFGFWQMAYCSKAPFTQANFRTARNAMTTLKSDQGRPLGTKPTLLVVGPGNGDAARDLINADRLANGASNTDRGLVEVLETPYVF